jgi:DNA-directed RNA polymerase subunit M/transcription elongation factor TFIIS
MRDTVTNILKSVGLTEIEAKDLEIGIFNVTIDYASANKCALSWSSETFQELYLAKARSVYANLLKNTKLIDRIRDHEFLPHDLPFITKESVDPDMWQPIIERERLRNKEAYEMKQAAMTDQIQCGQCLKKGWKSKITYYEKQIRSADEPITTFYKCHTCGAKWKH